jgi:CII-binding regulator of phage lambda lysogenization HflD
MTNGNGADRVEIQFDREDVLELQYLEEKTSRLQMQMQMLQHQAQQIHNEIEQTKAARKQLISKMNDKYGHDVSRFAIDTDTGIGSGRPAAGA